MLLVCM